MVKERGKSEERWEGKAHRDTDPGEGARQRMVVRRGEMRREIQGGGEMRKLGGMEGKSGTHRHPESGTHQPFHDPVLWRKLLGGQDRNQRPETQRFRRVLGSWLGARPRAAAEAAAAAAAVQAAVAGTFCLSRLCPSSS